MLAAKLSQEFIPTATRTTLGACCTQMGELSRLAMEGADRMAYLNLQSARAAVAEAALAAHHMMAAQNMQEWAAAASGSLRPSTEQAMLYGRSLASIFDAVQTGVVRTMQAQLSEVHCQAGSLLDDMARYVPCAPGDAMSFMRLAFTQASTSYQEMSHVARQAAAVFEGQLGAISPPAFFAAWEVQENDPTRYFSYAIRGAMPRVSYS